MRKRILFLFVSLTFIFLQANADIAPTVMLCHNGTTKTYMYYQIQNAVNDAVDGDTIYLTEGTFQPFNVNKRILVRGAGETTLINGNCEINISGQDKLTMPVLDAMCFNGDVIVKSAYKQFTLRKCSMTNLLFDAADYYDVKISQCSITNRLNLTNNVHEFNAFNSKIQVLYPHDYTAGGIATFEHCGIFEICDTIQGAVFNSCAINKCSRFSGASSKTNLIGCIMNSCAYAAYYNPPYTDDHNTNSLTPGISGNHCTMVNCVRKGKFNTDYYDNNEISALDGTPIGAYGGQHPFTQWPEVPGVTKYNLSIDAATKTLKVKLTVDKLAK